MILPSVWEIVRKYPYLIPLLVVILILAAVGHVYAFGKSLLRRNTCPGCRKDKVICLVACERVSRRLDDVDREVAR